MINKGTWVRIKRVILQDGERTGRLPDETKKVPFIMWDKGWLEQDASLGDTVTVKTRIGRTETGELVEAEPQYVLDYGHFVPELMDVSETARKVLAGGGGNG